MRLTAICRLAISSPLCKKAKSDLVLVRCQSVVSEYKIHKIRPRLDDKLEFMCWDPMVQQEVLYKEIKKIRSVPPEKNNRKPNYDTMIDKPRHKEEVWYRLHTTLKTDPCSHQD